MMESK